jgi:transglutaminase-like putative cysteine protease
MGLSQRAGAFPALAWRHLPRDARDTLFQLAVIGWTLLPHLSHLAPWCGALAALILLWRARLALSNAPLPRRWVVAAVLASAMGLTVWSEGTLLGREAGVTMLVVLMALKTLELRARRDALVVFFLGFFLVLTHFLYSQSLAVALAMLISVWGLLTALVLAHLPVGRPSLASAGAVAARAALLGAPVMIVLFLLFPRLSPLWGMPADAAGRTGLSGSLRMGGVAQIANDETIAMRVRFFGREPDPSELYFRGPVLGSFDGREWTRVLPTYPAAQRPRAEVQLLGEAVDYELTLEPSRLPLLPMLELTPDRPGAAPDLDGWTLALRADVQWQVDRPVTERLRVRARAWPAHRHGPRSDVPGLRDYVALPPGFNPRALAWAAALRERPELAQADAQTLAQALFEHIRRQGYTYTLEPGPYGRDAVDEFWFDRKLGFCEHFSVAFVVMMRALGVPARIVTGYQGSDPRPVDGYYVVRQSHAHAWAEYWQARCRLAARRPHRGRRARPHPGQPPAWSPRAAWWPARWAASTRNWRRSCAAWGGGEQPLEPVGAELLAQPAVRPAARAGRAFARLA